MRGDVAGAPASAEPALRATTPSTRAADLDLVIQAALAAHPCHVGPNHQSWPTSSRSSDSSSLLTSTAKSAPAGTVAASHRSTSASCGADPTTTTVACPPSL